MARHFLINCILSVMSSSTAFAQQPYSIIRLDYHPDSKVPQVSSSDFGKLPSVAPAVSIFKLDSDGRFYRRECLDVEGKISSSHINIKLLKRFVYKIKPSLQKLSRTSPTAPGHDWFELRIDVDNLHISIGSLFPPTNIQESQWWKDVKLHKGAREWDRVISMLFNYMQQAAVEPRGLTVPSTPPASLARTQPLRGWSGYVGR